MGIIKKSIFLQGLKVMPTYGTQTIELKLDHIPLEEKVTVICPNERGTDLG